MDAGHEALLDDVEALKAAILIARTEVAVARAKASDDQALIAHLKLKIAKLNRHRCGPHAERTARLLDQMELQLEELEACATSDEIAAEVAAAQATMGTTTTVAAFTRQRSARKPFPEHLPRERIIVPGPSACLCCGGSRLARLGEDVTETLEAIPRQCVLYRPTEDRVRGPYILRRSRDPQGSDALPQQGRVRRQLPWPLPARPH